MTLGFSPCPNDTYMMYGLLHNKIDLQGMDFQPFIMDVEELNASAMEGRFDITKLSFKTYYEVSDQYDLLPSGAALGRGNGPLLISDKPLDMNNLGSYKIAVPGMQTTATFLLRFAFPNLGTLVPMLFSDIESAIRHGEVDAGVIIHETRFLYANRGFQLIADLGEVWESSTSMPIPLGGFVIKKSIDTGIKEQLGLLISSSISFADAHYNTVLPFMKQHAQELEEVVIQKHVRMFVNNFSKDLGSLGRQAVNRLFEELNRNQKKTKKPLFV